MRGVTTMKPKLYLRADGRTVGPATSGGSERGVRHQERDPYRVRVASTLPEELYLDLRYASRERVRVSQSCIIARLVEEWIEGRIDVDLPEPPPRNGRARRRRRRI